MVKNSPAPKTPKSNINMKSPNSSSKNENNVLQQKSPNTTPKKSKKDKVKSLTPQSQKKNNASTPKLSKKLSTPKSEPPPKHKKLKEEIDEKISDEEFDTVLQGVGEKEKLKRMGKLDISKSEADDDDDAGEENESDEDEEDEDDDDDDDDDDDGDDSDEEEEDAEDMDVDANEEDNNKVVGNKKKVVAASKQTPVPIQEDEKRRAERDLRSLFIKGLAADVSEDEIRALSKDIVEVRVHISYYHNKFIKQTDGKSVKKIRSKYAFIEFSSEAAVETNKPSLEGKKVGDQEIVVDYVGSKSKHNSNQERVQKDVDPLKLYVTGFPTTITEDGLKSLFPKSISIHMPHRSKSKQPLGFAFVFFGNDKDAKDAHDRLHDSKHDGHQLVVLFARKTNHTAATKRKLPNEKESVPKKKTKRAKKKNIKKSPEIDNNEGDNSENDS